MTPAKPGRNRSGGKEEPDFYVEVLLRDALKAAAEPPGEAEPLLRTITNARQQIVRALKLRPSDTNTLLHGIDVLVRAAAAEHRLSPRDEITFSEAVEQVLFGEGSLVLPPKDTGDIPPPPA